MPALLPPPSESTTQTALSHEAYLRREITALRASSPEDVAFSLSHLLSSTISPQTSSPVLRAMREAVQSRIANHSGDTASLFDAALSALDAFTAVRLRGARSKVSAFFDQLCRDRAWLSIALFSASTVAEAAFMAVNSLQKKLTVIDTAPRYEGRAMVKRLKAATGAPVRYGLLSSCHKLLEGVDVVVLGAEEVCMNGAVVVGAGGSVVVQIARELGVSVVVVAQGVKYSDAVLVDWTAASGDVIKCHEVMCVVTEFDTGTWSAAMAPDVLKKVVAV